VVVCLIGACAIVGMPKVLVILNCNLNPQGFIFRLCRGKLFP
jgi:hypothetical protein